MFLRIIFCFFLLIAFASDLFAQDSNGTMSCNHLLGLSGDHARRAILEGISIDQLKLAKQLVQRHRSVLEMLLNGQRVDPDDPTSSLVDEEKALRPLVAAFKAFAEHADEHHDVYLKTRFGDEVGLMEALDRLEVGETATHPIIENTIFLTDPAVLLQLELKAKMLSRALGSYLGRP